MMVRQYLIFVFWIVCALSILFLSLQYRNSETAILAEVEPLKHAVSFQRAVKVKEIFVIPGQRVQKGDLLIRVERPDLVLEAERKEIQLAGLKADLERKTIEKDSRLLQARMSDDLRKQKLNLEIEQVNMTLAANQSLSENFVALRLWNDTTTALDQPLVRMKLQQLGEEKKLIEKQYKTEVVKIEQVHAIEVATLQSEISQLEKEIQVLRKEESELTQFSHINGSIGNVAVEIEELAAPYTTLLTLYEKNPTVIRALVNEQFKFSLLSGDEVVVESTNRGYKINGRVMEIGSRIIEYPNRLKQYRDVPIWGREIFIKIPEENKFLNGEKVFVIIKK